MSQVETINPELSVIIPIYNVAPYIEECVESLLNQTIQSIEYIFIDDHSDDNSLELLNRTIKKFPEREAQIKIIKHDKNKGISFTRQEGVRFAKGKWIIHCDSDDKIKKDAYEKLLKIGDEKKVDIVISSYLDIEKDQIVSKNYQGEGIISSKEFLEGISGATNNSLHGALWNKLIRRELWEGIRFPENLSYCEDVYVLFCIVQKNPNIHIFLTPQYLYYYRRRSNSLIKSQGQNRINEIETLITLLEQFKKKNLCEYKYIYNSQIINLLYRLTILKPNPFYITGKYFKYKKYLQDNKSLKKLKRIQLHHALSGHKLRFLFISNLNRHIISLYHKLKYHKIRFHRLKNI